MLVDWVMFRGWNGFGTNGGKSLYCCEWNIEDNSNETSEGSCVKSLVFPRDYSSGQIRMLAETQIVKTIRMTYEIEMKNILLQTGEKADLVTK